MTPSPTITPGVGEKMSSVEPSPSRSEAEQGLAEVVARAIFDRFHALGWSDYQWEWGEPLSSAEGFRELARAALAATRKPLTSAILDNLIPEERAPTKYALDLTFEAALATEEGQ